MPVYIKGSEELISKIEKIGVEAGKEARKGINKQTTVFKKILQTYTPVKTGALKRAMGTAMGKPVNGMLTNYIGVRSNYFDTKGKKKPITYAQKTEDRLGFAKKSFDENAEKISQEIINDVDKRIMSI